MFDNFNKLVKEVAQMERPVKKDLSIKPPEPEKVNKIPFWRPKTKERTCSSGVTLGGNK